jgi:hypothetical protein
MMNYDDPSASERIIVPALRWRAPHGHSTLSSSTSFSFLFFLLVGFFLVL